MLHVLCKNVCCTWYCFLIISVHELCKKSLGCVNLPFSEAISRGKDEFHFDFKFWYFFPTAFVVLNLKNFRGGLWLGLSREANSPEFTWSDHSITLYTNWATNQPDALRTQKTCVVANNSASNAGGWSDVDCSDRNGFVCRIRQGRVWNLGPSTHSGLLYKVTQYIW